MNRKTVIYLQEVTIEYLEKAIEKLKELISHLPKDNRDKKEINGFIPEIKGAIDQKRLTDNQEIINWIGYFKRLQKCKKMILNATKSLLDEAIAELDKAMSSINYTP